MYRLLVVDDEPFITDGMARLFQQSTEPEYDVYKAYTVQEALQWLDRARMDLVVSDIEMPGMSGLDLVRQIKARWPVCRVIFLSGYSKFDYVHTAMQLGADQYLLKSQSDEEILEAARTSISFLEKEQDAQRLLQKAQEAIRQSRPLLRQEYVTNLLLGEVTAKSSELEHLEIPLVCAQPLWLVGARVELEQDETPTARSALIAGVDALFCEYTGQRMFAAHAAWNRTYLLWLLQPKGESETDASPLAFISGTLEMVQQKCAQSLGLSVSFVFDGASCPWGELPGRWQTFRNVLAYQLGADRQVLGELAFFEQAGRAEHSAPGQSLTDQVYQLGAHLENGRQEAFCAGLAALLDFIVHNRESDLAAELYHRLCTLLLDYLAQSGRKQAFGERFCGFGLFALAVQQVDGLVCDTLMEVAAWLFEGQNAQPQQRLDRLVQSLNQYISENLGGDLTLNALADKVYLNPVYLSRVYKQITGQNVSDYITTRRLEQARVLLRGREMKIADIAAAVGYESPAHFSRVFKKAADATPQEYRDLHQTQL